MSTPYDIIVAGGGMVGASLARALAGSGLRVAVVEAWSLESGRQPSYDDRAIALAWGTRLILDAIGVWPVLAGHAEPIRHIHVSDRGHFGCTRLHADELQVEALGYVATAHDMGRCLLQGLEQVDGVDLFCPATLERFRIDDAGARVWIGRDDGSLQLTAPLLVAADGGRSAIREGLGIRVREWGYGQTAVISNLTPGVEPNGTAYERFTDQGPMAMLPLTGGRYGLVWTLDDGAVEQVLELDDDAFLARVQERFGNRLGRFRRAGKRSSYPLKLLQAKEHVRPRVALIGNAAHAVHPITGQGFNLGIRDVAVLAEVVSDAFHAGADIGSPQVLERYARWRRRDQQAVALMTDGLVRLFTNPLLPVRLARNLGLVALDLLPPAKELLTRQFMGVNGRLPRLSRGLPLHD
ncbi:MAG TPA: 2-octaprenyl-6-methoxyphenyl hydroxylase [Sedimenticola thiotaurini]|uniref:2-octaprenyl-6-methoxyphenyl hydroxylase n=1 Tax=Sedimenticola thiotaurini TaxID=1543721 RepID=A0A831WAR9_9GAMM|nr:2-octaprenyl-6-methoxyphenyl hydroxylase [Sedimenticola thiotaurini]